MQPVKDNFTVYQGSDKTRRYQWKQGDVVTPLTGATAKMQFRKNLKDVDAVYEMSTQNGLISITPDHWVRLNFTANSTSALGVIERMRLDGHLEITLADGRTFRIVQADITLDPELTR